MTLTLDRPTAVLAASMRDGVKTYGSGSAIVRALDGVSIDFEEGHFTAIMGPSGSGKSTLLHTLAGLDVLDSGSTSIGDTELGSLNDRRLTELRRDQVGFVFQAYNLVPTLTAHENIVLPFLISGQRPDEGWLNQIVTVLRLGDRLHHRPSELSGGQQQRVAVARALATRPRIVFADEPSGNLDSTSGSELLSFMAQAVNDFGQTIVMVTHDPQAAGYADRVVFLADGRVVGGHEDPTPISVLDYMKTLGV